MSDLKELLELAASNPEPFAVAIPEWGGVEVSLIPFTEDTVEDFGAAMDQAIDGDDIRPVAVTIATVVEHMVDENGDQLLDYDDEDDRATISSLDIGGYRRCINAMHDRAMGKSEVMEKNLRKGKRRRRKK